MDEKAPHKARLKSLWIDETSYKTNLSTKFLSRKKWSKPDDNKIYSFIPGTILEVSVKEGQKLRKGQRLLIFEAMKMKNRIYSPKRCVVKKIHVEKGEVVTKGKILLEVESL